MLKTFGFSKVTRLPRLLMMALLLSTVLVARGDPTATIAPTSAPTTTVPTPAVATTAAPKPTTAATTAAATTVVATTAAATTVVATTAAASTTAAAAAPRISLKKLNLGAIPAENTAKVLDDTKPFADALSKQLGIPMEVFVGNNYTAVIEALSSGKIDVAIFGPFSYVLAEDKYNAQAVLLQLGKDGATSYNSLIVTTAKTGIKTMADLKGHTFSFVDPASTSGNLIPRYTMVKNGLDPDKDVQGTFAGGHDASLLGVLSGKTDAGAVASDIFANLVASGKVNQNDVVIVNKSDPIPNTPVAVRKELSDGDKAAIKAAFMAIKDPAALQALSTAGYTDNSDKNYDLLRDIAKTLNLDLTKLK